MRIGLSALLALGWLAGTATAQDSVVIYRCTDATGAVSVQNDIPCARGSQQQRRVIETEHPPSLPAQPALPPPAVLPTVTPLLEITASQADEPDPDNRAEPPAVELQPPPPLFSCRTWNREALLTDDPVPAQRCAPLETTGLGGSPAAGAGVACEIKQDTCEPVAPDQLCEQWRKYLNDTEAMLQFGRAPDPAHTHGEIERIGAIVAANDCSR